MIIMVILIPLAFFIISVLLFVVSMVDKAEAEANRLEEAFYTPPIPETTVYHTWASMMPKEG